jgi:hypothetical protein
LFVALTGCVSTLTDELAVTVARTRESNVEASRSLADTAARLPATLDRMNEVLAAGTRTAEEMRATERSLTSGIARVTSASSDLIENGAKLVGHLDGAVVTTGRLLEDARASAEATRTERDRIVVSVAAIASSIEAVAARVEETSRTWVDQARELRDQQNRAARALTDVADASARTASDVAIVTSALGRLAVRLEPDAASASKSLAAILGDVAKISGRVASDEGSRGTIVVSFLTGALGAAIVVAIALGVRTFFRKAVARAVAEAIARGDLP